MTGNAPDELAQEPSQGLPAGVSFRIAKPGRGLLGLLLGDLFGVRKANDDLGAALVIQKFKNKTGYKKRQGHRQELTRVKITSIK